MWGNKERNSGSDGETREEGAIPARRGRGQDPALRLQKTQGKHTHSHCQKEGSPLHLSTSHMESPEPIIDSSRGPESQSSRRSG